MLINPRGTLRCAGGHRLCTTRAAAPGGSQPQPPPQSLPKKGQKAKYKLKKSLPKDRDGFGAEPQRELLVHLHSPLPAPQTPSWVLPHPIQPIPKIPCAGPAPWKNNRKMTQWSLLGSEKGEKGEKGFGGNSRSIPRGVGGGDGGKRWKSRDPRGGKKGKKNTSE